MRLIGRHKSNLQGLPCAVGGAPRRLASGMEARRAKTLRLRSRQPGPQGGRQAAWVDPDLDFH